MSYTGKGQHGGYWDSVNKKASLSELFAFLKIYTEYMITSEGEINPILIILIPMFTLWKAF